jgi:hypothetical protein
MRVVLTFMEHAPFPHPPTPPHPPSPSVELFDRAYTFVEYARREVIYNANIATIRAANSDPATNGSFTLGVNQFTDMTQEEFRARLMPARDPDTFPAERYAPRPSLPDGIPTAWDWSTQGVVTPGEWARG